MSSYVTKASLAALLTVITPQALADSYRYMHVTIETPWLIFIFLLVVVMMPFILMAVLYWHNAFRRNAEDEAKSVSSTASDVEGGHRG